MDKFCQRRRFETPNVCQQTIVEHFTADIIILSWTRRKSFESSRFLPASSHSKSNKFTVNSNCKSSRFRSRTPVWHQTIVSVFETWIPRVYSNLPLQCQCFARYNGRSHRLPFLPAALFTIQWLCMYYFRTSSAVNTSAMRFASGLQSAMALTRFCLPVAFTSST